ncbi:MAG: DUF2922 domain-containing protein [Defluviitaleaceae bacterium]|nr:DUF2922 domain-containing protein [Defluviitaleaceae bacterium]
MTTVSNRAVVSFRSNLDEIVRFTIPRACLNKTSDSARASMEAMIAGGAIITGNGVPTAIHGAKLVTTERTPIIQPA